MKVRLLFLILNLFIYDYTNSQYIKDSLPEEEGDNRFLREEWFYKQRALPFEEIPLEARINAIEQEQKLTKFYNKNLLKTLYPAWINIGPAPAATMSYSPLWGNISGRMRSVVVHPVNPDIIYIGAANGGVWKTTDGGNFWFPLTENEASLAMGAIAIDPNDPEIIYAGTGEAIAGTNRTTYFGAGLLKSTNGGANWQRITNGFGSNTHFSKIAIRPSNSNYIYASLATGLWYSSTPTNQGIWRSTNAGLNWTRTLNVTRAFDILIHPTGHDTVYAAVGNSSSTSGFYKSTDAGLTWTQQNSGLISASSIRRMQIAQSQSNPSILFTVTYSSDSTRVFKSTNGGNSWFRIGGTYWFGGIWGSTYYDQGWYDLYITVNPQNPNVVYVGNVDLMKSTDGGITWTRLVSSWDGKAHVDQHSMAFHPVDPNIIFIVNDGGINKSTNGGASFSSLNTNLSITQFYKIATSPHDVSHVIGGTQDNATQRRPPNSSNWVGVIGGDGGYVVFDYSNPNYIYGEYVNGSLYRSNDGGNSFYQITNGITESGAWITPILINPVDPSVLYTATTRVYMTTNRGTNWTPISSALWGSVKINAMDIHNLYPNYLLALASEYTSNPGVFISSDGGYNWNNITSGLPARYMTSIRFHPDSVNIIFVTVSGFGTGHIYRSTNFGSSWTNISTTLPDIPVNDIFIDPENPNLRYFAATDLGVYVTENSGNAWVKLDQGLPNTVAVHFSYHYQSRTLRVGTHGRGIFEIIVPGIPGSISGKKYFDVEQDSSIITNPILSNWVIKLYKDSELVARTTTNQDGIYTFTSILPGTYVVEESLYTGWLQTFPRVESPGVTTITNGINAGPRAYIVELQSAQDINNLDFGNFQFGSVSGKVFIDLNSDSSITNDPPLINWVVKLYKDGIFQSRTLTNSDGEYLFDNLDLGNYTIEESLKTNWVQTFPKVSHQYVTTTIYGENAAPNAYSVNITANSVITGLDFGNYTANYTNLQKEMNSGWNLVSIGLNVVYWNSDSLFKNSSANIYEYDGKYKVADRITRGKGYWVKYPQTEALTFTGLPFLTDTIYLKKGWNLIGSISEIVPISSIISEPPNLIGSYFFSYNNNGYNIITEVIPFESYWVKANSDGFIILSFDSVNYHHKFQTSLSFDKLNEIKFSDGKSERSLFFTTNRAEYLSELPPLPPFEIFDVRFATGKFVETFKNISSIPIIIQSSVENLEISWKIKDGNSYILKIAPEQEIKLQNSGSTTIKSFENIAIEITEKDIPDDYKLFQNYPNPFNPSTQISYSLPTTSRVVLKIYDILGREIDILVDGIQEAGYHTQRWIPKNRGLELYSGIYYYRITCSSVSDASVKFTYTRKMMFFK